MTPLRLELHNFFAHRDTSIDYEGARLVVAVGENGAGKSALTSEAIEWALYGRCRQSNDEVVTWGEVEATVALTFRHGGATYRVTRGRSLRSGGKSWAELQVSDGDGWRPLTGATIAETQAAIERLLGMDHATFRSSVLLKQQDLGRFAHATAGDRKRILSQVLGLDIYAQAEQRCRNLARDLERDVARRQQEVDQLAEQLTQRDGLEQGAQHWRGRVAAIDDELDTAEGNRANHERRLREIAGEQAATEAAQAEVARLTTEITALAERWRAADARRARAEEAGRRAMSTLEQADAVERAAATVDELRGVLAAAELDERAVAEARTALDAARRAFETENEAYRASTAEAEGKRAGLVHTVSELEAAVAGLAPVTCPGCGKVFAADPADLAGRLHTARQALLRLPEPKEPYRVGMLRGQLARRESELRDAEKQHDPAQLADRRAALRDAELLVSQQAHLEGARAALAQAEADAAAAKVEMADVEQAGKAAREALNAARGATERLGGLVAERDRVEAQMATLRDTLTRLAAERDQAATALGRAEQALDELEKLAARHEQLVKGLAADNVELGRLRKLVTAFGANGIPARIIASVLPEFAAEANEVLAETLPGWAVELRAQRARKAGDGMVEALDLVVLLDGAPRPFEAASGGQQTVIVLALALALSRLAGRRTGATIRYFGVDEPDGLDVQRRAMFGQALRQLAHRGDLELISLVTHNEDLAEYGDRVHRVHANSKGSVVEVVA